MDNFSRFFKKECEILDIAGIIAEFNPLHNGHKHIIETAKKDDHSVVCVISGNFVQRGDTAIIPKFSRAESAIESGADMVLELPVPWSMSTAQNFALGGISQLSALNIDTLYFGSECGDTDTLSEVANMLLSAEFEQKLKKKLSSGKTFASIRQATLKEILGNKADVLSNPNDTLAVEYITAAKKLGLNIKFKAVKRLGSGHNDRIAADEFASSTLLRSAVKNDDLEYLKKYMPESSVKILSSSPISDIALLDTAIISGLRLMKKEEFKNIADITEGLDNLIFSKVKEEVSLNGLCEAVKSKRYTMARIRRIILSAYLGIDNSFFLKEPPYVRVLGFTDKGASILPKNSNKPIITKVSQISELDSFSKKVFELENTANDIYALSLDKPKNYTNDFKSMIIKK